MSKLIEFKNIFENKVCKDVKSLLIFIKYIFASCKKQRLFYYPEGYLIPIRWSNLKNKFVIDLGTNLNRDIEGIDLKNIDLFFNKNEEYVLALKNLLKQVSNIDLGNFYNLQKNESKFIAIVFCLKNKRYYNLGLYSYVKTNKRLGVYHKTQKSILIDNTKDFKDNITNKINSVNPIDYHTISDYRILYNKFISYLKNKEYIFSLNNKTVSINLKEDIERNTSFKNQIKNSRLKTILLTNEINNSEEFILRNNIVKNIISLELYNFLFENSIINSAVYFYDDKSGINYKIKSIEKTTGNLIKKESKNSNIFLLPVKA
tara:strand:- start:1284 stop:2234 length:951 start_codon:yes stop_codon:yes gene_type:complete